MSYIERETSLEETVIVVRDWQMSYIERGEESLKDSVIVVIIDHKNPPPGTVYANTGANGEKYKK